MVFENLFLITIKDVDLQTGLRIVNSLSKVFMVRRILIKRVWETSQPPFFEGGQSMDYICPCFEGVFYA